MASLAPIHQDPGPPEVTPTRSGPACATNLGRPATAMIGRQDLQVGLSRALVAGRRAITLVGPSGIGKSLAARWAAWDQCGADWWGGVWWCDASAAEDRDDVVTLLMHVFDVPGPVESRRDERLGRTLAGRGRCLVVLDGCDAAAEDGLAELVERWTRSCPELSVIATAREPLGIKAEHVVVVGPLGVPDPDGPAGLVGDSAGILFLAAAGRARLGYAPGPRATDAACDLLCRLDGNPASIAFAAARLATHDEHELVASAHEARTAPDAARWAVAMLSPGERAALDAVAVFQASFPRAAAGSLLGDDAHAVLLRLECLGILRQVRTAWGAPHFEVPPPIRRLVDPSVAARQEHARWFAGRAARWRHSEDAQARAEVLHALGDLRQALDAGVPDAAAAIARTVAAVLEPIEAPERIGTWVRRAMEAVDGSDPGLRCHRAHLLAIRGRIERLTGGDGEGSFREGTRCAADHTPAMAHVLLEHGRAKLEDGDARAADLLGDAAELARQAGRDRMRAEALSLCAEALHAAGRLDDADQAYVAAQVAAMALGDTRRMARNELRHAELDQQRSHTRAARDRVARVIRLCHGPRHRRVLADALCRIGRVALDGDDLDGAEAHLCHAAHLFHELSDPVAEATAHQYLGEAYLHARRASAAAPSLARAAAQFESADALGDAARALVARALAAMSAGAPHRAREFLERALGHVRAVGDHSQEIVIRGALCAAYAAEGERLPSMYQALVAGRLLDRLHAESRVRAVFAMLCVHAPMACGDSGPAVHLLAWALAPGPDGVAPVARDRQLRLVARMTYDRLPTHVRIEPWVLAAASRGGLLAVARDGTRLKPPHEPWQDLSTRPVLARLLEAFARERQSRPGVPLSQDTLVRAAWPEGRHTASVARSRLTRRLDQLRELGLGDLLRQGDAGCWLDASYPFVRLPGDL